MNSGSRGFGLTPGEWEEAWRGGRAAGQLAGMPGSTQKLGAVSERDWSLRRRQPEAGFRCKFSFHWPTHGWHFS